MGTCRNDEDKIESTFVNFSKTLLRTFVLLTVIALVLALKNRLLTEGTTMFYVALFIVGATVLFTVVGTVDSYLYSNLVLGIGMAVGLQIMDWRSASGTA
jgi:dolichol kinase